MSPLAPSSREALSILGCPCETFADMAEVKQRISAIIDASDGGYSVAINAEKIQRYGHDGQLRKIIDAATLRVPDGAGAVLGLRLLYGARSVKVDLPRAVLELSNVKRWRLFVGGASEEVNAAAVRAIKTRYPDIDLVGRINGYVPEAELAAAVRAARPQLMLLAMGSPRQEVVASKLLEGGPGMLVVGCGGALDILAGKLRRAPPFMVENNLEWLYRLYKEPSRWRRQLVLPRYMLRLLGEVVGRRARRAN
jgi:N-acetylglucosaminyldiphosphoundecaprenol N-acetyl-beta-D-mannosaminyltransferase